MKLKLPVPGGKNGMDQPEGFIEIALDRKIDGIGIGEGAS